MFNQKDIKMKHILLPFVIIAGILVPFIGALTGTLKYAIALPVVVFAATPLILLVINNDYFIDRPISAFVPMTVITLGIGIYFVAAAFLFPAMIVLWAMAYYLLKKNTRIVKLQNK